MKVLVYAGFFVLSFALAGGRESAAGLIGLVFDRQGEQALFTGRIPRRVSPGQEEYSLDYRLYFKAKDGQTRLLLDPRQGFPPHTLTVGAAFGLRNEALVLVREGQDREGDDVLYRVDLTTGVRNRLTRASHWQLMDLTFASLKYNKVTDHVTFSATRLVKDSSGNSKLQSGRFEFGPVHSELPTLKLPLKPPS